MTTMAGDTMADLERKLLEANARHAVACRAVDVVATGRKPTHAEVAAAAWAQHEVECLLRRMAALPAADLVSLAIKAGVALNEEFGGIARGGPELIESARADCKRLIGA